ncbi:MAG: hypothetical protein H7A38_04655 [Chlamydiales bacterium]|nr:hypothetical protein [Chlamydiales bacterium]
MSGIDFSIGSAAGETERDYLFGEAGVLEIRKEVDEPSFEDSQRMANLHLSERIHRIDEGIYQVATIDRVVRVKTFSNQIVSQKIRFWDQHQAKAARYAIGGAAIGVVGIFFSFKTLTPLRGITAVAGIGYALYELLQMSKAKAEVEKWKQDHAKEIADQRLSAFKHGLVYAYKQDHAGASRPQEFQKILSKNELQGLYGQYFHAFRDQLASAHDEKSKLSLLSEAARYSPLASHIYRYALLPQDKVDQMEEICSRYHNFIRAYNSVDDRIKAETERVHESYKTPIEMIEQEKEKVLKPVLERYEAVKLELLNEKTAKLEGHPPTGVEIEDHHRHVKLEFAQREQLAETQFKNEKKEALKEPHEKLQQLQKSKEEILKRIQSDRSAQLLPLFPYALALHQEAYKLYRGEAFSLTGLARDPATVFPHPMYTEHDWQNG